MAHDMQLIIEIIASCQYRYHQIRLPGFVDIIKEIEK